MGQNCCTAASDKSLPGRIGHEASPYRNVRQSPSWSFRWDNRTHIEDIMENSTHNSHNNGGNPTSEVKSVVNAYIDGPSDGGSSCKAFQASQWRKSYRNGGSKNMKFVFTDQATASNSSPEINGPFSPNSTNIGPSIAAIPSSSVKVEDPSSSTARKSTRSPGIQLRRQISDGRIPSCKSLIEGSSLEGGRHSFVLGKELSAAGSRAVSSDGWSMRAFSELVSSSQREILSFNHENFNIFGPNSEPNEGNSSNLQTCGICSKLLEAKSPWSSHKIVSTNDLPIAAVLVCGHVYHAECLEASTSETDMYDPPCQVCGNDDEGLVMKGLARTRELKGKGRVSRTVVNDANSDGNSVSDRRLRSGNGPLMGASSSTRNSFSKPFLKRHFSVGSTRPLRSASENEMTRKKWFWPRYSRD